MKAVLRYFSGVALMSSIPLVSAQSQRGATPADSAICVLKAGQGASAAGNHAQARSYANHVRQFDRKCWEACILMGNATASLAGGCEALESWSSCWLAYDCSKRARSKDPSVAEIAGERMGSCVARFPTKREATFQLHTEGKTLQAACCGWNESPKVRTRK